MKTGAVIEATKESLAKIGGQTVVERLIATLHQVGCFPIVIVMEADSQALEKQVSRMNVICMPYKEDADKSDESVEMGLKYIMPMCEQVLYVTTASAQRTYAKGARGYTPQVLLRFMDKHVPLAVQKEAQIPNYPIIMNAEGILAVLGCNKSKHLLERVVNCGRDVTFIDLCEEPTKESNTSFLRPVVSLRLANEKVFFGSGPALLLTLIDNTGSVKEACRGMKISYTKAWTILNSAEQQLGYPIVTRQHGGKDGGSCFLTAEGRSLLQRFQDLEEEVRRLTKKTFDEIFMV